MSPLLRTEVFVDVAEACAHLFELPDQEFAITSFVREFRGPDAIIECTMTDPSGRRLSAAVMTATCVDKNTGRGKDWPAEDIALFYE